MLIVKDEDLEVIVRKAVNPSDDSVVKIVSHRVESYSNSRHGIMGNHYILSVEVTRASEGGGGGSSTRLQFFVKTPPESATLRDSLVDEWVSREEVRFFAEVYPALMANYKGASWCAECYLSRAELLVLEDLRARGFSARRDGAFDGPSLESVVCALARFHASSVVAEAALGQPLDRLYPGAFREKIFGDAGKAGRANRLGFRTVRLLADKLAVDGASLLPDILATLRQLVQPLPGGGCNVICHGDLWRSNIMFNDDGDRQTRESAVPRCMIVDYQMLRYASPSCDLAVLLYVHARPELRASSELQLLRRYYSTFQRTVLDSALADAAAVAARRIPSFPDFLRDYQQRRLIGMACACMSWPKIVFQRVIDDPAALKHWYFDNRIDIYEEACEQDANYAKIMRDCLLELIDEGKRILQS